MTIKIVTDSTADLPEAIVEKFMITVIPCYINIDNQSYLDGKDITRKEFYEKLPTFNNHPTTSAPGIDSFIKIYQKLLNEGAEGVVSIHISQSLSNVTNVAKLAAEAVDEKKVRVIDGGQITLGTGLLVHAAAQAAIDGADLPAIIKLLNQKAKHTHSYAILNTMEFLRRSGRVSWLAAGLGSLLDIKPMLIMHAGKVKVEKIRTSNGALYRLIKLVEKLGPLEKIALVHTNALQKARDLQKKANHLFPNKIAIWAEEVTPVIGAHVGPGALGIVCITSNN